MPGRLNPYRELETALGYRFRNRALLECALVHPSYRYETGGVEDDNQRLEFLGDAVLGMVMAAYLFERYTDEPEGVLTARRSQGTRGRTLAGMAAAAGIGTYLKIGKGEAASGGHTRPSNLADALEALIGAAWLDGGPRAVDKMFRKVILPALTALDEDLHEANPKGRLQELAQARWKLSPEYRLKSTVGPPHQALFTAEVRLPDGSVWQGQAPGKQAAEVAAARAALATLDPAAATPAPPGGPGQA